jgi:hypothetical protein
MVGNSSQKSSGPPVGVGHEHIRNAKLKSGGGQEGPTGPFHPQGVIRNHSEKGTIQNVGIHQTGILFGGTGSL